MKNEMVLQLCIAETNKLLEVALAQSVLRDSDFVVKEVFWSDRDLMFKITLGPKQVEAPSK